MPLNDPLKGGSPFVMQRPHRSSRYGLPFALALSAIVLLAGAGVCQAGFTGPFHGFKVCAIANPSECWTIGLWRDPRTCADFAGSFVCEHGPTCFLGSDCSCQGPGIAEMEGLFIANLCEPIGLKAGCYHFDHGDLAGPMKLKLCKAQSDECWCQGGGNFEGSKGGP